MVVTTSEYLKPISFLVVDSKPYMRRVVKNVLEVLGAKHIDEARDGADAYEAMKSVEPDIVLTELLMYPVNGLEFLDRVRKDDSPLRFTPVIMVTSETRRERVIAARNAGVTEFVAKPISAKSLFLRIREVIERPRPFVDVGGYFGPDRRRRTEDVTDGEDRRGKGAPEQAPGAAEDSQEGLSQDQIDRLVAGGSIKDV